MECAKQNRTQWAAFAPNGNDIFALNRNLGQVYGVYGVFQPKKMHLPGTNIPIPGLIDYLTNNSANFNGLNKLENLVKKIRSPKWPWPVDETLRAKGEQIYKWPGAQGGCVIVIAFHPLEMRCGIRRNKKSEPIRNRWPS